jgi:hypothetical protein
MQFPYLDWLYGPDILNELYFFGGDDADDHCAFIPPNSEKNDPGTNIASTTDTTACFTRLTYCRPKNKTQPFET